LQGTIGATGTFSELQSSGLNFARQLGLEAVEDDGNAVSEQSTGSPDNHDSFGSLKKWKRQNSISSEVVRRTSATVIITVYLVQSLNVQPTLVDENSQ
jgi:hypothetical protein